MAITVRCFGLVFVKITKFDIKILRVPLDGRSCVECVKDTGRAAASCFFFRVMHLTNSDPLRLSYPTWAVGGVAEYNSKTIRRMLVLVVHRDDIIDRFHHKQQP